MGTCDDLTGFKVWLRSAIENVSRNADKWMEAFTPLPGDAGFRRYFIFEATQADDERASDFIAAYSPPQTEKNKEFVAIAKHLAAHGVRVPRIISADIDSGYFLLENLGSKLYLDFLDERTVGDLYRLALDELLLIQTSQRDTDVYPPYDQPCLRGEMELFTHWFVPELLGYQLSDEEEALIESLFHKLEVSAMEQPQVVVHRDYHSRNIVYGDGGKPGVIDFQDAVIGPVTYDLVSLLRDCYIRWPEDRVKEWATEYRVRLVKEGVIDSVSTGQFIKWFDWMGLQRHIKVLGIFARLWLRDGKPRYLNDLPLVIHYTLAVAKKYPELASFTLWFESRLMPLIRTQPWMKSSTY